METGCNVILVGFLLIKTRGTFLLELKGKPFFSFGIKKSKIKKKGNMIYADT